MANGVRLQPALPPVPPPTPPTGVSSAGRTEVRAFEAVGRTPPGAAAERSPIREAVPKKELSELVEELSDLAQVIRRELRFSVDEESGRTIIRVIDSATGELIRQIPPDEVMALVERFRGGQPGLLKERA